MREAHPIERTVGMEYYVSDADGAGGRLRAEPEDFRVEEIEAFDPEPLDADPGAYPHVLCRVTLRSWDTNDFAGALSDALGISRERVSWAGTKDKHAVTTQLFSVARIDPEDLRVVELGDADIELLGRTGRPILFGDLAGNRFEIRVRDADAPETVPAVTADLAAFATGRENSESGVDAELAGGDGVETTVGVPNYFGQQRFGSKRPVTHEVGLEIVRGNWKGAVLAYVGNPHEREPEETRKARAFVEETEDWAGALERLPRHLGYERSICHRLVENSEARSASLFSTRRRMLSERLARGLPFHEPVAGDVVCFADADAPAGLPLPDTDRTQRVTEDRLGTVRRHCERGRAFVTAPLVGTETDLGDGEPGEIERAVLDDLGLAPGDFDLPDEFGSEGTRRAILLRTDLTVEREGGGTGGGLQFAFPLPKGSYATVVLREYLKADPGDL
ncbi:tRNA pseudouridine(13) synthase TruD [Halobacteriales archaeon QH_3_68_24]|nr:MAG: tRNA pseudouridine(13) synthase TruD [Halobacteriales archaeon QH_3_68_24]